MIKKIKQNKKILNILIVSLAIVLALFMEFGFEFLENHDIGSDKGRIDLTDKIKYVEEVVKQEKQKEIIDDMSSIFDEDDEESLDSNIDKEDIENEEIIEYEEVTNIVIEIDLDRKYYVNKLRIDYTIDDDLDTNIHMNSYNEYGNPSSIGKTITFEKEFTYLEKNVQSDIKKITFNFPSDNLNNLKIDAITIMNDVNFNIMRFIFISLITLLISMFIIFRDIFKSKIEKVFLLIVLTTGVAIIIFTSSIMRISWDDIIHFPTTYNLFNSEKITTVSMDYARKNQRTGGNNSDSLNEAFRMYDYLNKNTYKVSYVEYKSSNFIQYSDYVYIPSAIVLKICQILKIPFVQMYWLGKLINLVIYSLIGYYTIKHAKIGKHLLFVLFLIPGNIFLASQYSKDAYVTGLLMLGISTFANMCVSKDKVTLKEILIFVLSILFGSFSKAIYIPFMFLLLLIPSSKFKHKKQSLFVKIIVVILTCLMLSSFILPSINTSSSSTISDVRGGTNISTSRQVQLILSQPISFIKVFKEEFINRYFVDYMLSKNTFLWFCHYGIGPNISYWLIIILMLFSAIYDDGSKKILSLKSRLSLLLITAFVMCFIMMSMYLTFSTVGAIHINGIQNRYYLPLLFPLLLCLSTNKFKSEFKVEKLNITMAVLISFAIFYVIYELLFIALWI